MKDYHVTIDHNGFVHLYRLPAESCMRAFALAVRLVARPVARAGTWHLPQNSTLTITVRRVKKGG